MKMHRVVVESVGRRVLWARTENKELVMIPRNYANGALESARGGDEIMCGLVKFNRVQKIGLPKVDFFGKWPGITSAAQHEPNPCAWKQKHDRKMDFDGLREARN
jgi:hypothetical protein